MVAPPRALEEKKGRVLIQEGNKFVQRDEQLGEHCRRRSIHSLAIMEYKVGDTVN